MIRKSSYVHNPVVWICFRALEVGGVGVLPGVDATGALVLGGSVVPGESEAPAVESVELGESGGKEVETGKAVEVGIVSLGAESRILLKLPSGVDAFVMSKLLVSVHILINTK